MGSCYSISQPYGVIPKIPLCVALDNTLIQTNISAESIITLLKISILYLFYIPIWLIKGKSNLKNEIATRVNIDVSSLPYNKFLLYYLYAEAENGRSLFLTTSANIKFAKQIADYLGIFQIVIASDQLEHVSGRKKLEQLRDVYEVRDFDYIGSSRSDLALLPHAHHMMLVNPKRRVKARVQRHEPRVRIFHTQPKRWGRYLKAVRLHQWLKNTLIFVPLLAAHRLSDWSLLAQASVAFVAFGLCASSVYLFNDLFDLTADRNHPRKRCRPLAAGTIPIIQAMVLAPTLLLGALALGWWLPAEFMVIVAAYYALNLGYSLGLKKLVLVDVLILATLYTLRIVAGAAATSVVPSFWLLAFSLFLFFSLAMLKRYTELLDSAQNGEPHLQARGYQVADLDTLISLGGSSGYAAVLVLALYLNSDNIIVMYRHHEVMWLLCPLWLFWISRVWLLTRRGQMHDDPVVFAIRDRASQWVLVFSILIFLFAL